jgi:hypothetical protein
MHDPMALCGTVHQNPSQVGNEHARVSGGTSMERDHKRFPRDENGDVLWRMFCNGDRLDKPRMIEFALIFPMRKDALAFGAVLLEQGYRVQFSKYEKKNELMWQIMVTPVMLPDPGLSHLTQQI